MRRAAGGRGALSGVVLLLAAVVSAAASTGAAARPIEGRMRAGRGTEYSTNWSGYAAYGTTFDSATGSWKQPVANCSGVRGRQITLAAFWVGLDGYESNTVEQTGTEADCEGARPVYYAWYELYPQRLFVLPDKVEPGDELSADVTQTTLTLVDHKQKWSATEVYPPGGLAFSSAEWIAEAPTKSMTNFGSVSFSSASASSGGTSGPIDAFENDEIVLVNHGGPHYTERALPSGLEGKGSSSSFSIEWLSS